MSNTYIVIALAVLLVVALVVTIRILRSKKTEDTESSVTIPVAEQPEDKVIQVNETSNTDEFPSEIVVPTLAVEPIAEVAEDAPTTETTTETVVETVAEEPPVLEPVAEVPPAVEPAAEPAAEPVVETVAKPKRVRVSKPKTDGKKPKAVKKPAKKVAAKKPKKIKVSTIVINEVKDPKGKKVSYTTKTEKTATKRGRKPKTK